MIDSDPHLRHENSIGNSTTTTRAITVLGAGPAGALISIFLARRGYRVTALDRFPDMRCAISVTGRSINLALADRGIHALKQAGAFAQIESLLVPMRGRLLHHTDGAQTFIPYGSEPHEVIYSVGRRPLTAALLSCAERQHNVEFRFRQTCIAVNPEHHELRMQDIPTGKLYQLPLKSVIGADGAGSVLRRFLVESVGAISNEEMLDHGYKELVIPGGPNGAPLLDAHVLHIWPRGEFMLIALPNIDGSFTATLFLPHDGPQSFAGLATPDNLTAFFRQYFPDAYRLMPDLAKEFFAHPTGAMGTVRCDRWSLADQLILIGDAAHAIVPFHGQGMNCAFEDCVALDAVLATTGDLSAAFVEFQRDRKPNTEAIADMAIENYVEMRDTVRDDKFQLQKALSLELERRHPTRFIPRYSMVMFHHEIPYAIAFARGNTQYEILNSLTRDAVTLTDINYAMADQLIEAQLPPLR